MKKIKDKLSSTIINGFDAYYTVRTDDQNKPVLLFLHGGPGGGNIALSSILEKKTTLTDHFTMIQYDQRGAGKSFNYNLTYDDLTVDKLLEDTSVFIDFILKKFGKKKLLIVGHSFGTILGLRLCKLIPEKILGYVAIAQMVNAYEGEVRCLKDTMKVSVNHKNGKYNKILEESKVMLESGDAGGYIIKQRDVMLRLGLITHKVRPMNPKLFFYINVLSPHCRFKELQSFSDAMETSTIAMWNDIIKLDFNNEIDMIEVPVLFITGEHDRIARLELVKPFIENLNAPYKKLEVYKLSGHSPQGEEKDLYESHVIGFLNKTREMEGNNV